MAKNKFKKDAFDSSFISPMSEQKLGAEPGPDVFSIPVFKPRDVLGVIPGGSGGKNIGKVSSNTEPRD